MMLRSNRRVLSHQSLQERLDSEFMSVRGIYPSTSYGVVLPPNTAPRLGSRGGESRSYGVVLQTHEYSPLVSDDEPVINPFSVANINVFSQEEARRQLEEVRQEAEEAFRLDHEIDPIPESAYDDARSFLEILFHSGIPMPDIGWAEDGSLSFEWFPEDGVVTMGIYGDGLVIYTAFFEEKRQVEGICELSDAALLSGFLATLLSLLFF